MKLKHVRIGKDVVISDALTFMAGDRTHADEAYAGDIIGLHNHGTIQIGDTFTQGEDLKFTGIPNFAPESVSYTHLPSSCSVITTTSSEAEASLESCCFC